MMNDPQEIAAARRELKRAMDALYPADLFALSVIANSLIEETIGGQEMQFPSRPTAASSSDEKLTKAHSTRSAANAQNVTGRPPAPSA